ncbi:MAG: hypothetical protein EBX50_15350 [Chitinophagia bacterium]|nr:hypothetical protein [Chitinophagia bacterium]
MRWRFTFFFLFALSLSVTAQSLTGIWKGYFNSSLSMLGEMPGDEKYKFEVQLLQQKNALKGVSYSYKTTVFYGKADMTGIFTPGNHSILLKENKLIDLKISGKSEACLMTCYLDYTSIGKMEFLDGTFFSMNIRDKSDCGSGKIHLEKVKESDFGKEDFLIATGPNTKPSNTPNTSAKPAAGRPGTAAIKDPDFLVVKPPTASSQPKGSSEIAKTDRIPFTPEISVPTPPGTKTEKKESTTQEITRTPAENLLPKAAVPRVLVERENDLVKRIITDEEEIRIDLYDNGTIDNDTITVYHNNRLVTANQRLNFTPITFYIKCNKSESLHEIVVVAENLGDIPPNTALMVVTAGGKKRQEIFLASTEQKNAKVIIEYKPLK